VFPAFSLQGSPGLAKDVTMACVGLASLVATCDVDDVDDRDDCDLIVR
jgi:hypothetical protein